jgi:hypothetical protein
MSFFMHGSSACRPDLGGASHTNERTQELGEKTRVTAAVGVDPRRTREVLGKLMKT